MGILLGGGSLQTILPDLYSPKHVWVDKKEKNHLYQSSVHPLTCTIGLKGAKTRSENLPVKQYPSPNTIWTQTL